MAKIIIAGGRDFTDYDLLINTCDDIFNSYDRIELVGGGANGADRLGKHYSELRQYRYKEFPANWEEFGKVAGFIRNVDMAHYSDVLIAFWDGRSKGTLNMIENAFNLALHIYVVLYGDGNEDNKVFEIYNEKTIYKT